MFNVALTGQAGSKPRPALVVSADGLPQEAPRPHRVPHQQPAALLHETGTCDHPLKHWKAGGLRHPSTVRISNILAVEKKIIKRVLGAVHADDLAAVEQGLHAGLRPLAAFPALQADVESFLPRTAGEPGLWNLDC